MRQGAVPVGILVTLLLAGCVESSGSSQSNASAPPAEFDETTGAIQGTVVNDENLPIESALVGIVELRIEAVTDSQGRFTLSNVQPGTQNLIATAIGYEPAVRKVEVVQGSVIEQHFTLTADAVTTAYFKMRPQVGNVQCTVRAYPGAPTTGAGGLPKWTTGLAACGVANLSVVVPLPPDRFLLAWEMDKQVNEVLLEMEWKSTQASGRGLDVVLEHAGMYNSIPNTFGRDLGLSPLQVYVNNTTMLKLVETSGKNCYKAKCKVETRVFGAANTTEYYLPIDPPDVSPLGKPSRKVDAGFVFDQRFTQYLSTFYHMERPSTYTALKDQ